MRRFLGVELSAIAAAAAAVADRLSPALLPAPASSVSACFFAFAASRYGLLGAEPVLAVPAEVPVDAMAAEKALIPCPASRLCAVH